MSRQNPFHRPHVRAAFMFGRLLRPFGYDVWLVRDDSNKRWRCRLAVQKIDAD